MEEKETEMSEMCAAQREQQSTWALINRPMPAEARPEWPSLGDVSSDISGNNYSKLFEENGDVKHSPKILCANGVMCTCRIEWFGFRGKKEKEEEHSPKQYSGMFRPGQADYGLLRMSSALGDISGALPAFAGKISYSKLFPCVALKFFRCVASSCCFC